MREATKEGSNRRKTRLWACRAPLEAHADADFGAQTLRHSRSRCRGLPRCRCDVRGWTNAFR
jgi:hypothetical protein